MKKLLSVLLSVLLVLSTFTIAYAVEYDQDVDMDFGDTMDDGSNDPTEVFVEVNENNVRGGYLTQSGDSYTANPYKNATFEGWFDKDGNLITTDVTVTPEAWGDYYAARFSTENLIDDAGFESYTNNQKVYDHTNLEKQLWTVHSMTSVKPLTGTWGSMYASSAYKKSGNISFKLNPPYQLVGTDVSLQPNTEYYIGFDWLYTTKIEGTYITDIQYGFFVPDSTNTNMVTMATGASYSTSGQEMAQATWNKTGFLFKTGDTIPENVEFAIVFRVDNPDESVSTSDENQTQLYVDDIMVTPAEKFEISLNATNVATIKATNGSLNGFAIKGEEYFFEVISEPETTPVVSANDTVLTADANGVYSFLPTGDTEIKIDCGTADEGKPAHGKDYFGRDLTKYNSEVYLEKIWEGDTVYHETALFLTDKDTVKLLYPVDEVISLRSYSLDTTFIKGVDFEITEDGCIKRLEGSRIPVYEGALTTDVKPDSNAFALRDDPATWLKSIGDATHAKTAVAITYKHSNTFEDGYQPAAPASQKSALNGVLAKLENGEEVNVVVMGDSISCGWSSSGVNPSLGIYSEANDGTLMNYNLNVAPYAPTFAQMIEAELKAQYPNATINFKNLSLGGKSSGWAASNVAARMALWTDENGNQVTPDLIMTGFGVNDSAGNVSVDNFKANMKAIVDNARTASGNAEMEALYYSPFLPNQLTATWDVNNILAYENALAELANEDENVGVAKVTSVFAEIIKSKAPEDYISSYWNHGNDFTARIYATTILEAFLGEEEVTDFTPADINGDDSVNLKDLVALAKKAANWDVEVNSYALDVNGDGVVDLNDVNHLARYLAGWDVKVSETPYLPQ